MNISIHGRTSRVFAAFIAAGALALTVNANPYEWTESAGGAFETPGNWDPAGPPGNTHEALFTLSDTYAVTLGGDAENLRAVVRNGVVTFNLSGNTYTLTDDTALTGNGLTPTGLTIALSSGETASAVISGGTLNTAGFGMGDHSSAIGTLTVTGTTWTNTGDGLYNGTLAREGRATLNINGGAQVTFTQLNMSASGTGARSWLNVSGQDTKVTIGTSAFSVGRRGDAHVLVENKAEMSVTGALTISERNRPATFIVDDATVTATATAIRVGYYRSTGVLRLRNAASFSTGTTSTLTIGGGQTDAERIYGADGQVIVESGSLFEAKYRVVMATKHSSDADAAVTGSILVTGDNSRFIANHASAYVYVGNTAGGAAIIRVEDQGYAEIVSNIELGRVVATVDQPAAHGEIRVRDAGSELLAKGDVYVGGISTAARGTGLFLSAEGGAATVQGLLRLWSGTGTLEVDNGAVTAGTLDLQQNAVFRATLYTNGFSPMVTVTGAAGINGAILELSLDDAFAANIGVDTFTLVSAGTLNAGQLVYDGTPLGEGDELLVDGYGFSISYLNDQVTLLATIPEPGSLGLLLAAGAMFGLRHRRRRNAAF